MPSYIFTGTGPRTYPETRDASGVHLGTVTPGDIRIFDEPPADGFWTLEIPPRGEGGGEDGGSREPDEPRDETPPGPVPAAPAVIPGE